MYLVRNKKRKVYHPWDGKDTYCTGLSKGGTQQINFKRFTFTVDVDGLEMCQPCRVNKAKAEKLASALWLDRDDINY